jgi:hypothetical protein
MKLEIANGAMNVEITSRASEVFQVLLADLYFFKEKLSKFNIPLGTLTFHIGTSKVGVFVVRSYNQICLIKNRTPKERSFYFNEFLDVIFANNPKLAYRLVTRFLTVYLVDVNPTPTFTKFKLGHNACQKYLPKDEQQKIRVKMQQIFSNELKDLQAKREAKLSNKFYNLLST